MAYFPCLKKASRFLARNFSRSLLALGILALSDRAQAATHRAFLSESPAQKKISGLTLKSQAPLIITDEPYSTTERFPFAIVEGTFQRPGWNLLIGRVQVPCNARNQFTLRMPLHGRETPLYFYAVGPRGEVETAVYRIVQEAPRVAPEKAAENARFSIAPGLGYSALTYKETGAPDFAETALTAKLSANYSLIPKRLSVGVTIFGTLLPLGSNQQDVTARFIGANARIGWSLPFVPAPWSVSLMTGGYVTSMIVPNNAFGYTGLLGPQLFVTAGRALSPKLSVGTYGKLALMGTDTGLAGLQNREIATGLSLNRTFENGNQTSITVDISDLAVYTGQLTVHSTSFSLGVGFLAF